MTPDELEMVWALVAAPGRQPDATPQDFLARMDESDGRALALRVLREAIDHKSSAEVEAAMVLAAFFGSTEESFGLLVSLVREDWHESHEDVVSFLDDFRTKDAIPALLSATRRVPDYMQWDDTRALAVRAVYALSKIDGEAARNALEEVVRESGDDRVSAVARQRLEFIRAREREAER